MKYERIITSTVLTGTLLTGCTAKQDVPVPQPTVTSEVEDLLTYSDRPKENFSIGDCHRDSENWAKRIDSEPNALKRDFDRDFTIGLAARYEDTYPILATGAIIRSLGASVYKIVTADDAAGESVTINLAQAPYSRVLEGEHGYDGVLTARLGDDNEAYFMVNCMTDYDFHNRDPLPLPEDISPVPPIARTKEAWDA